MASDTGAPWLLPYPEDTDLVRDGASDIEALAVATAAGLSAAGNPGIGTNVVQTVKLDKFTTTSATYTVVTGLTATITPTTNTSKVLIVAQIAHGMTNGDAYGFFKVTRGGTDIYQGDADGSMVRSVFGGGIAANAALAGLSGSIVFLDSPGSATAVTYEVECRRGGSGAVFVNRSSSNTAGNDMNGASSITVIEVAP
jgi:hypothetical protein